MQGVLTISHQVQLIPARLNRNPGMHLATSHLAVAAQRQAVPLLCIQRGGVHSAYMLNGSYLDSALSTRSACILKDSADTDANDV